MTLVRTHTSIFPAGPTNTKKEEYEFTEKVDVGYAEKSTKTMQTSFFTEKDYEVRIAPKILSMSAHSGG